MIELIIGFLINPTYVKRRADFRYFFLGFSNEVLIQWLVILVFNTHFRLYYKLLGQIK